MKRGRGAICGMAPGVLTALAILGALPALAVAAPEAEGGLQPYQMVRSLQLVQDRIAGGDHAALPMQNKLLELIDARFRRAGSHEFAERRNFDALMIYAMSGGNPATLAASLEGLALDEADAAASAGVRDYLAGNVAGARDAMASISHSDYPQEVAGFLALVKGSVVASDDADAGMATLDRARLLAPGTLVEEAALRRILSLAATAGDGDRFMRAAEQYARRFLRSPYAAQFAETFVAGVITLREALDLKQVEDTVAWMTQEQADTVYLRLARRAAIDGDTELLAFTSQQAQRQNEQTPEAADPRRELYASISSVTSETVEDVLADLVELDASRLSTADKALLAAARAVAEEVVAPVGSHAARPVLRATPAVAEATEAATDPRIEAARLRLAEIDKMLEESEP